MRSVTDSEIERGLVEKAKRVLPGGTFGNVASNVVIREGHGGRVWDESGREYVDFLLGSGPMLVGHAHPQVTAAAQARIAQGTTFFANNRYGIELAEAIVEAVPCAEQVRFVSTGSEADLYAMRAARAFRKRDKILKFEGGYHGMSDYSLMSLAPKRPGNFPQPIPDSAGIPRSVREEILVAPFNDIEAAGAMVREHRDDLAGVILEPFQRIIPPLPGFLEGLRKITAEHGIPLIFDEVVTGFRFAYGGAQEYYGVIPDLCTLGKVIGGGFPLAAIAGRAEIMRHFDRDEVGEEGFLMQVGTLSGHPTRRCRYVAAVQRAPARTRCPEGGVEILRLTRPHPGGHPVHLRRLGFGPQGDRRQLRGLFRLCHDSGTQHADRGRIHLDQVAGFQKALRRGAAVRQQCTRIRCGAGRRSATDYVARIKREVAR